MKLKPGRGEGRERKRNTKEPRSAEETQETDNLARNTRGEEQMGKEIY